MSEVLLSSVCRPFGGPGEGDSVGAELFHAQVTRAQGMFSLRQVIRAWGLDYIAANLKTPAVVLHYPSEREFVRELRRGRYRYVGIHFVVATFHKVRRMVELVRRHAPGAEVVLGGYGTVLPDDVLAPYADHVCRTEGIGFLRGLLGEPVDRPIRAPYAPIPAPRLYSVPRRAVVGHLTAGLGCPNGCDFCSTSHFFKRRYLPFLERGRDVYEALLDQERRARRAGDVLRSFILIDEDFFLHERRAREFLDAVRQGGRPLSLMGFGSVRGLSRFTPDEIAEMGFDTIWTAFEGTGSGFRKLRGRPIAELHAGLRSRGVAVLASMILGFPHQDRSRLLADFERLVALEPAMTQMLIYFAFPRTPLHERMLAENRYLPEYRDRPDLRRWDGFSMHFEHPHFGPRELEDLQRTLYRREFERLGPSVVRMIAVWLEGWRTLRGSANPLLRARAERKRQAVIDAVPALTPAMLFGPTRDARARARSLYLEIRGEFGGLPWRTRVSAAVAPAFAAWTWATGHLGVLQQPRLRRVVYERRGADPARCGRDETPVQASAGA